MASLSTIAGFTALGLVGLIGVGFIVAGLYQFLRQRLRRRRRWEL